MLSFPPVLRRAARACAALDLDASRALYRGELARANELEHARCAAWFAARELGCDHRALEYLTARVVRVAQALERQRVRHAPAANDSHGALASA